MEERTDVAIIGAGPAGLSAAIWCADLALETVVLESTDRTGGQLHRIHNPISNYPGLETVSGQELAERFAANGRFRIEYGSSLTSITLNPLTLRSEGGDVMHPRAVIIATGVRRRTLAVPGEKEFAGRGIIDSGARDPAAAAGKHVVIIGGGDAAAENALILGEFADKVAVVHRRSSLSARPEFVERISQRPNIELCFDSTVESFNGDSRLESLTIQSSTEERSTLPADLALIRIGVMPNSEPFSGLLRTDAKGYIEVDRECRTSVPGIYAAGDVANPVSPTIATAAGMGATAAKAVYTWLNT
jgi:thioredoxin reductase (NADPH)